MLDARKKILHHLAVHASVVLLTLMTFETKKANYAITFKDIPYDFRRCFVQQICSLVS